MAKRKKRLSRKQLAALAKGRRIAKANRRSKKKSGYHPRALSRRRFKKKRVGIKRFGRSRGHKVKVLTTGERRRRRGRRRSRKKNPWFGQPRRHAKAAKLGHRRRRRRHGRKASAEAPRRRRSRARKGTHLTKRQRAARKAARTRKRNKALRAAAARKGARKRKKSHGGRKRSSGRRKKSRTSGHRKSPKRVRAAKKAARTRARNRRNRGITPASHQLTAERRRRKHRRGRRRNPVALLANPVRRRRHSRRRNPLINPLGLSMRSPMAAIAKASGYAFGFLFQDAVDRWAATHPLSTDTGGNVTDQPVAGQIFDSEAPQLPIWGSLSNPNWMRIGMNAAALLTPWALSRFVGREFLQRWAIAAAVRTLGKVATDVVAAAAPPNAMTLRLYGGEYAASTRLQQITAAPPASASPAGTFAGVPRGRQLGAPPTVNRLLGDCGDCGQQQSGLMTDPLAGSAALTNQLMPTPSNCGCGTFNPLTAGTGPAGDTIDVTPTNPIFGGGGGGGTPFIPPMALPIPTGGGSGTGSGGGSPAPNPNCNQVNIASMQAALAQFNGTGPQPHQPSYDSLRAQLAACGVSAPPWTPPPTQTTVPLPPSGTVVR